MAEPWTPGPWKAEGRTVYGDPDRPRVLSQCPTTLWSRTDSRTLEPDPTDYANARLIAAAPEMAELLDRVSGTHVFGDGIDPDLPKEISALLARIRGEA